jgi:hypothetical protein
MNPLSISYMETLVAIFDKFCVDDQRKYYATKEQQYREAMRGATWIRAGMALITGLASALVVFLADGNDANIHALRVLVIIAIIAPAIAAGFNTLADLYQWQRMYTTFGNAFESMAKAAGQEPVRGHQDPIRLRALLDLYVSTTLNIMGDETNQWGQLIREPEEIEQYLTKAQERVDKLPQDVKDAFEKASQKPED